MMNTIVLAVLATTLTSYTPYWHAIVASSDRSNILARRVLGRREGWGAMGEGERSGWSGQQFDLFIAVECKSVGSGGRGKRTICLLFITFWLPPRSGLTIPESFEHGRYSEKAGQLSLDRQASSIPPHNKRSPILG
jgi:hypothetical protein